MFVKRGRKASPPPPPPSTAPIVAAPIAIDAWRGPTSIREALERGDAELLTYASEHVRWADVSGSTDTSIGYILKDWQAERGKKLCVEGTIATIERRDVGSRKTFVGELRTEDGDRVMFTAVGSTGDLVRRSRGRFCGVVTGKVELLGMFELPENQSPVVEQ